MGSDRQININGFPDISGKIVIITGAAQGIGNAIARACIAAGAKVLAADLDESISAFDHLAAGRSRGCRADVSDGTDVAAMVNACRQSFGAPEVLINVAAISNPVPFQKMDLASWQKVIAVNLTSVFLCTQAVLPQMTERRRGSIINFSSIIAHTGGETSAHYTAAKAGVEGLSRTMALELGPCGIRVNCIAPGMIDTRMLALMPAEQRRKVIGKVPLRRVGQPEDLIGVTLLLASDASSYITGQTFHVNGGLFLT
ncbi:MAG: 3-oxoacyl-ACP reductase [Deltaproteobacteria bacterium HGW-Deltaproteobacteria-9]|nr:MAG: 3-oxoacyl-ACP reductase [Deltaproteobacteria bacterium HGW-Deltaproteobacteria-9]